MDFACIILYKGLIASFLALHFSIMNKSQKEVFSFYGKTSLGYIRIFTGGNFFGIPFLAVWN